MIRKVIDFADLLGFEILHLDFSPIKGPEGNIEYLVHLRKNSQRILQTMDLTEPEAEKQLKSIIEEKSGYSSLQEMADLIVKTVQLAHGEL